MGGFYLYNKNRRFDLDAANTVFRKKKLEVDQRIEIGGWELVVYKKTINEFPHYYSDEHGFLLIIGALMYKEYSADQIPEALYQDIHNNRLDRDALIGHFTIIYRIDNTEISFLMDSLRTKHVFCLDRFDFFSSSMLACVAASEHGVHIDPLSVYEKAMIGIVIAPDTYFREVKSLNADVAEEINSSCNNLRIRVFENDLKANVQYNLQMKGCVDNQIDTLDRWFEQLKCFSGNCLVDTGLSGGYDSRLVFSLMSRHLRNQIHLHTHDTEGVHAKEKKISFLLAESEGLPCETIPTLPLNKVLDIDELMEENIYFFDGRSSFVIGGFNETYTPDYRIKATGFSPISLTGIGGEIYRNYYHIIHQNRRLDWYIKKKIVNKPFNNSISDHAALKSVSDRLYEKISKALNADPSEMRGHHYFRRYYGEIMMADGQGVVLDAYNQVSCCFAPFISERTLRIAYEDLKLIGIDGVFEAKMIDKINHRMAEIPSTYGHNMVVIPKSYLLKQFIRAHVSDDTWTNAANLLMKGRHNKGTDKGRVAIENSKTYIHAKDYFQKMFPEINLNTLYQGKYEFKNMSVLICTLYLMRDKIIC